jgi:hypothetical protein
MSFNHWNVCGGAYGGGAYGDGGGATFFGRALPSSAPTISDAVMATRRAICDGDGGDDGDGDGACLAKVPRHREGHPRSAAARAHFQCVAASRLQREVFCPQIVYRQSR